MYHITTYFLVFYIWSNQIRPHHPINDERKEKTNFPDIRFLIDHIFIKCDLFKVNKIFNVSTIFLILNLNSFVLYFKVSEIIKFIKSYDSKLKVKYVDHPIMNQLSYSVKNDKFKNTKFIFKSNIQNEIVNTLKQLKYLKN